MGKLLKLFCTFLIQNEPFLFGIFPQLMETRYQLLTGKQVHTALCVIFLILAFEANSALSRDNETKIMIITHSAPDRVYHDY